MSARDLLIERTLATAEALEPRMRGSVSAEEAELLLVAAGDLVRLGYSLPDNLRSWLLHAQGETEAGARHAADQLRETPLPIQGDDAGEELELAVHARDRVESVRSALARLAFHRRLPAAQVPGFEHLATAVASFDPALGRQVRRAQIEAALGDRIAMLGTDSWTDRIPIAQPEPLVDAGHDALRALGPFLERLSGSLLPGPETLHSYVGSGSCAGQVEAAALADVRFASLLAETIDSFEIVREPVALVAMRWRQAYREATRAEDVEPAPASETALSRLRAVCAHLAEIIVPLPLFEPLAAASDRSEEQTPIEPVELGLLAPLPVAAEIELLPRGLVALRIADPNRVVRLVRLGDAVVRAPEEGSVWRIEATIPQGPVALRVEGEDGAVFESRLLLTPGGDR